MTYLERKAELNEKMKMQRIGIGECKVAYNELILDMAKEIESLKDELKGLDERLYLRKGFGD